jgi:hypothetical protein
MHRWFIPASPAPPAPDRHLRREDRYLTHSPLDFGLLGLGTLVFGTMDGRHSPGAGLTGFRFPPDLSPEDRTVYAAKVRQIGWRPAMVRDGHLGDHMGCTNSRFSRRVLAPIVLGLSDPGMPVAS